MYERFNDLQKKLTDDINTKVYITDWQKYNADFTAAFDESLKQIHKDASFTRDRLDRTARKLDDTAIRVTNMGAELELKMPMTEQKKIYDFFKKYAQYKDLKDLYKKTVPEISKFEDKLAEFYTEVEKMKMIMTRFDEVLVNKANKEALLILKDFINDEFARKDANDTFVQRQTNQMIEVTSNVTNLQELVKF
jgi:predicted nuclease with TOPRIM domain